MQNLKENWLFVREWHEEFGKFLSEHSKVSKMETFDGILLSRVKMELKINRRDVRVMSMKNHPSTQKFQNLGMGSFWAEYIKFELRK